MTMTRSLIRKDDLPARVRRTEIDPVIDRQSVKFGAAMAAALKLTADSANSAAVQRAIGDGSVADAVSGINLDPVRNVIGDQQDRIAGEYIRQALMVVGNLTPVEAVIHFDLIEPNAVNYAAQRAGVLIRDVQAQVRETVRGLVVDALNGDYTVATLAEQIQRVVPLSGRQAKSVENVYSKTFDRYVASGKPATKAEALARQAADRASTKAVARRAESIARTELMTASNSGRLQGFSDGVSSGLASAHSRKEWMTAGNPCPICDPLDGQVVGWDQPFSLGLLAPPVHPSCRCVIAFLPPDRTTANPSGSSDSGSSDSGSFDVSEDVQKQLHPDGTYTFAPTFPEAMRLAGIARNFLLGRMPKATHDEEWDRILNFRRQQ